MGDLQMIPTGVTCLETVTFICDGWGQQAPAKMPKTLIQVTFTFLVMSSKIPASFQAYEGLDSHPIHTGA